MSKSFWRTLVHWLMCAKMFLQWMPQIDLQKKQTEVLLVERKMIFSSFI